MRSKSKMVALLINRSQLAEIIKNGSVKIADVVAAPKFDPSKYMSVQEAATILGVSHYTINTWCRHGRLAATKNGSKRARGPAGKWMVHKPLVLKPGQFGQIRKFTPGFVEALTRGITAAR